MSASVPLRRFAYGPDASQYAELCVPETRVHQHIAIVIHGGFWRSAYDAELGRPLAADLAERGIVSWNLEYRRNGNGGGYPQTFLDVAAGIDALTPALVAAGLSPGPRVAIGHSAGGHLALWAAGRSLLPAGAPGASTAQTERLDGVISQAGVLDLALAHRLELSADAAGEFMGSTPESDPSAWAIADPALRLATGIPLVMLHGRNDADVPVSVARSVAAAARLAGVKVDYREFDGDHYGLITPGDAAWEECVAALLGLGTANPLRD
ncbi:S9 family peptidase [Paeniglutamicibacter sp. Y32M11]|uniref:alpha/beta hydrolase family protein n=1 Tax=Paeniglutamicibacter sp. Y32M11 TaxID=2853258 RepID=UPI00104B329E|nr:alpha/beta hydrolase [Paeniglutamicibacter sp. Y32M11]QXQ10426.1 alpha/beta hydrolase [Paeniglutamicibacter sp. Y32M11]